MEERKKDDGLQSELEFFRREWLSEVRAKHPAETRPTGSSQPTQVGTATTTPRHSSKVAGKKPRRLEDDHDYTQPQAYEDEGRPTTLGHAGNEASVTAKEPTSALDHYEAAVEKESQGSLGDSLQLYRKAFRMDDHVDKKYKDKYFPKPSTTKPLKPSRSNATPTVPSTAHHSPAAGGSGGGSGVEETQTCTSDLITSFATLSIIGAPSPAEGMPAPPCPISDIPSEVLSHIFQDVAVTDVRDFARLAQVCKLFAYVVATDATIWRRISQGREFGFPGMHHKFTQTPRWDPIQQSVDDDDDDDRLTTDDFTNNTHLISNRTQHKHCLAIRQWKLTQALLANNRPGYNGSWKNMFRNRPRIRFGGAYISTVNYWRSGQAGPNQVTWGSPMHVVTYYRYLRFFRDGTVLSLLTTHAPTEVVPHFTREKYALHAEGAAGHLPGAVVAGAFRGVWRMGCSWGEGGKREEDGEGEASASGSRRSGDDEDEDKDQVSWVERAVQEAEEAEANVFVETEGVGKYTFEMELVMRSAGRAKGLGTRNNKLVWRSFASYNRLTDDRAEFALKNDKPFFFSRVASYGIGEDQKVGGKDGEAAKKKGGGGI